MKLAAAYALSGVLRGTVRWADVPSQKLLLLRMDEIIPGLFSESFQFTPRPPPGPRWKYLDVDKKLLDALNIIT